MVYQDRIFICWYICIHVSVLILWYTFMVLCMCVHMCAYTDKQFSACITCLHEYRLFIKIARKCICMFEQWKRVSIYTEITEKLLKYLGHVYGERSVKQQMRKYFGIWAEHLLPLKITEEDEMCSALTLIFQLRKREQRRRNSSSPFDFALPLSFSAFL